MPSSSSLQARAKGRALRLVKEVLLGPIGCVTAALSLWVIERREIQTGHISFAQACTVPHSFYPVGSVLTSGLALPYFSDPSQSKPLNIILNLLHVVCASDIF